MNHLKSTPTSAFIFYRSYSRWSHGAREKWDDTIARCLLGLAALGKFTEAEIDLIYEEFENCTALPSGRFMWCGGTKWSEKQVNYSGSYNCTSTIIDNIATFGYLMDLSMQGAGCGAVLELDNIAKLPPIKTKLNINVVGTPGNTPIDERSKETIARVDNTNTKIEIIVGDSRRGWVDSYMGLIQLAVLDTPTKELDISIDVSSVRPKGEPLTGFGGSANPSLLPDLYIKIADILNGAIDRQLTSVECCLSICEAAMVVVVGNIRRSALIFQFSADDELARGIKDNLWKQHDNGSWYMPDPSLDALRMGNHTTVFHTKPTLEQCVDSVRKQYYSGEGAIQWAGEAVARSNADLLDTPDKKAVFLGLYPNRELARDWLDKLCKSTETGIELNYRMNRYGLNPCGEILMADNHCNLAEVHLNTIDPFDLDGQVSAFKAAALSTVALLSHEFDNPRYQRSRELDPIVGVSFTGLFDFFVHLFGIEWLQWWQAGRPTQWGNPVDVDRGSRYKSLLDCDLIRIHHFNSTSDLFLSIEEEYLYSWKSIVIDTVTDYCERHGLKVPNRCTTVQPAGSKSLLTGAAAGWAPPKAARYIRRMTFGREEPIALAAIDLGYNVIPSQSDKDDSGNLLNDIYDPRVTEWLLEIPCAASWADMPGVDSIDISQFSALAQLDFYIQVQQHYTTHNTSATIELREDEVDALGQRIFEAIRDDEGYISAALLARFDDSETFPRLPFEPIDSARYQQELVNIRMRRLTGDFDEALAKYDRGQTIESGPSGCDSDKCLMPESK